MDAKRKDSEQRNFVITLKYLQIGHHFAKLFAVFLWLIAFETAMDCEEVLTVILTALLQEPGHFLLLLLLLPLFVFSNKQEQEPFLLQ